MSAASPEVLGAVVGAIGVLIALAILLALAALALRLRNEARARRWATLEAKWTPVILNVLGGDDPTTLTRLVGPDEGRAFVGFVSAFTQRVRGRELEILRELVAPYLELIEEDLTERRAERRARAVRTLAELGMAEHEESLVRALDDPSDLVAMVAARRLFSVGKERHFLSVLNRLSRFTLWSPRFLAGMLASGGSTAIAPLRGILINPRSGTAENVAALAALRLLNDPGAANLAQGLLSLNPERDIRVACLRLIRSLGHSEHADSVRAELKAEDAPTRQAAVETLGAIGGPEDIDVILEYLDDPSPWVRMGAARALDSLGGRSRLLEASSGEGPAAQAALEVLES